MSGTGTPGQTVRPSKPRRGLVCPRCPADRLAVADVVKPVSGATIRYCVCTACGLKLKTRETIVRVYPPKPEPVG